MRTSKRRLSVYAVIGVLLLLVFPLGFGAFTTAVIATVDAHIESNGPRLIVRSNGTPVSCQWMTADTLDGTYSPIAGADQPYYDITAGDERHYIKAVVDGVETDAVGPIGKLIVFDLAKGKVTFNTTYSGKDSEGNDLTGDHHATNLYVIRQSDNTTFTTNNVWFCGNHTDTQFDVTIDGVNMGRASYPTTHQPNTSTTGGYANGTIDIQPSGYAGQKNVVLRLKGENIVRAIHYYTDGYAKSSLKITDINGDFTATGGSLYVPVKVEPDKIDEFVNSHVSYNHWNSAIGGDDSKSNVTNFEIAGGKLQVLTTYSDNCTAIGAGGNGSCTMTISGGEIVAHSNGTGTAIGGGIGWFSQGGVSDITITGGTVYAKNHGKIYAKVTGYDAAGVTPKSASIISEGAYNADNPNHAVVGGVAIGSGSTFFSTGSEGKVTITGGDIEAYATFGNGIGGGNSSSSTGGEATINISGGTVQASSIGGGDSKNGTGGKAKVTVSGEAVITLSNGIGGGKSLSGDGGEATIIINGGTMTAEGSIGGGAGGGAGNGGKAVVTVNGGSLTAAAIGGGLGSAGGHGGAAEIYVNEGNGVIRTGTIGGGDTLNTTDGQIGYAKAEIKGGDISGQFLMAAGGTEPCSFVMTGGTLHGVDTADESVFTYAQKDGAAVYMDDPYGVVDISGGIITDCSARNGGAIYMSAGTCSLSGTALIEHCASSASGGAIYLGGGTLAVDGGSLRGNASDQNGGGIYLGGGTLTVSAGGIAGNRAAGNGGGAFVNGGNVFVVGGAISGNTANSNGGGVAVNDGNYSMVGGNVDGNTAVAGSGGGIYVSANANDVAVGIYSGSVSSNVAGINGGALAVVGEQDGTKDIDVQIGVQKPHFDENGTIACDHDQPEIAEDSITACPQVNGNAAGVSGGGVFVTGNSNTELNIYCLTEDETKQNSAGGDDGQSHFMKVEGGKVTVTTSNSQNMDTGNLSAQDAHHGNTQIKSTIYITGGNMALWGEMTNPSITDVITVDITKAGDSFEDHRLNADQGDKRFKLKYFENFKDAGTQITTGQYKEYEISYGELITISGNIYSHPGYTIKGWNTKKGDPPGNLDDWKQKDPDHQDDWTGWYEVGLEYLFDGNPIGDLTIYAIWEANGYTVIYDANADSYLGEMSNDAFLYNEESKLKKNAYHRSGYDFVGWSTDKEATDSSPLYKDEQTVVNLTSEKGAVVTLYAQWKACNHNPQTHAYRYSVVDEGRTLRRECSCDAYSEEVRLAAEDSVYDRQPHSATVVYTSETWRPAVSYEALDDDQLVNGLPYYAGRYNAGITENGVTASVTYTIEKAQQSAPPKPDYHTNPEGDGSVLSIEPVESSPLIVDDPEGYDCQIEYKLVYFVGDQRKVVTQRTPQNPGAGSPAVSFYVDVVLTNYYVYVNYTEGSNYLASADAVADSVYFFAGENIEIIVNNPEGLLTELKKADGSDSIVDNGALLQLTLQDGYYFPQDYEDQMARWMEVTIDGLPETGVVDFVPVVSCSQYSIQNIKSNMRIVITLPPVGKQATLAGAITEGQAFGTITGNSAAISRDSAFTVRFDIDRYVQAEFETPVLCFDKALPVGTTIIMADRTGGGYYRMVIEQTGTAQLCVTDFIRMGDTLETPFVLTNGTIQLQFVVDFSRTADGMGGDTIAVAMVTEAKPASKAQSVRADTSVDLRDTDRFSLTTETDSTLTFRRERSTGTASRWDKRDSALVFKPTADLPADAHLQLVCGDATTVLYANSAGCFVYPLPAQDEGAVTIAVFSDLLSQETVYTFDVRWLISETTEEHSPMNGEEAAAAQVSVSCRKENTVSLKIISDNMLYAVGGTVKATVSWADLPQGCNLEIVLMVKSGDGRYSSTGVSKEVYFMAENGTQQIDIPLAGNRAGSYCLQITAEQGLVRVAKAQCYFLLE